jgi:hypothetical protein
VSEQESSHVEIECDARDATISNAGVRIEQRLRIETGHDTRPHRLHQGPGILEFLPALQADLASPFLDRKHPASLTVVMASEGKPENRK